MPRSGGLITCLALAWLIFLSSAPTAASVRVGVVLDLTSDVGKKSLTSISMALEDFYAAHANATRRVELRVRDSRGDVVTAARAADDLIRNDGVQSIIGPLTSAEAEFIAYLGNHTLTPILTLAPVSAALKTSLTPFFLHTTPIDSNQAELIAAILDMFTWRTAILVYEDSPYGAGILPELLYTLQGYNMRISDSVALPVDATEDYLDAVIHNLKGQPTRVFIVHMLSDLAARVFKWVTLAGMMSDGYVWIATSGTGNAVDSFGPDRTDHMQGLITFRPYVPTTAPVLNFTSRFKERYQLEYPSSEVVHNPNVLLLWAYDTAWALAAAAANTNGASSSITGRTILHSILNMKFDGLAGQFRLVSGQLQLSAYEIVNIIGKGARTVGFWIPNYGIFKNLIANDEKGLKQIIWPGDLAVAPKGWDMSSNGRPLRISVPSRHGFKQLVDVSYSPTSNTSTVTGYCIDVFNVLMKSLPYPVSYQFVPFSLNNATSYDSLLSLVYEKKADAMVGDTTITMGRMNKVAFTMPFTDTGLSMIVVLKKETSGSMWIFLQPLTSALWMASLTFFFFTGLVVWVIEHRINPEFHGTPSQQFGIIFYFAFSTLVFSHKEKLQSNLSRFVVIVWVFVVLILTSSYTASLTSMLTVQRLQATVTGVQDLLRNGDYVGYQRGSAVEYWLEEMGFHRKNLLGYDTVEGYADALQKGSENGGVSAIFDEIPYLKIFLSKYCEGYTMIGPTYRLGGFGFAFPIGSPLVHDLGQAIMSPSVQEEMARMENKWFGDSGVCQSKSGSINSSRLGFSNFSGLFLISGITSGLALLIYLAIFAYQEQDMLRAEVSCNGSRLLKGLHAWLERRIH